MISVLVICIQVHFQEQGKLAEIIRTLYNKMEIIV